MSPDVQRRCTITPMHDHQLRFYSQRSCLKICLFVLEFLAVNILFCGNVLPLLTQHIQHFSMLYFFLQSALVKAVTPTILFDSTPI